MRVEVITPDADPDHGGFGTRVHSVVSMFSRFADVRVVLTDWTGGPRVPGVEYRHVPLRDGLRTRVRRLHTYYRTRFPARPSADAPDFTVVESLDLLGLHQYGPQVPTVLDEHNVYWNLLEYEMANAPFFRSWVGRRRAVRRLLMPELLRRAKRFEVDAIRRASRTLVTSEADRKFVLAECPETEARVKVLPNCVDVQRIPSSPDPAGLPTVVFVGDFNYGPNLEAAEFVIRDLAPALPAARFLLVGPNLPSGPKAPNVVATGYISDLHSVLREASVCIAPLVHGSGTRIKILTYLAAARPVVATAKACEGLPLDDGRHAFLRDDPAEFRAAVATLLEDREARERLARAGREVVEARFDWRVHVPMLRDLAREICEEAATGATGRPPGATDAASGAIGLPATPESGAPSRVG